jgi:phage baseplate assembly protein gpV
VSDLIGTLRAIVRDELARTRAPELGTVTRVLPRDADGSKNNHQVDLRLRGSGVELQHVPVAVGRLGLSALPREGDLMLVVFVGGDLNAPVVLGSLYDDQAHPPVAQPVEVVYQPPDEADSSMRRLHVELPNGTTVTLGDETLEVVLGSTSVVVARDGDVVIEAQGKIRLAAQGDMELEASGDLMIAAQGQLTLQGLTSTLEAQGAAKVKGAKIALAGLTDFSPA